MAKVSRNDTLWYPTVFMIILAFVMTLILALLDYGTKDKIELQQKAIFEQKLLYAMNIDFANAEEAEKIFDEKVEVLPIDFMDTSGLLIEPNYYVYRENGEVQSYAFPVSGKGLWGTIDAFVAMDKDMEHMIGMDILSHSETPGLGGRIEEDWFKEQFRGLSLALQGGRYFFYPPEAGSNIEAITGATLTSGSMRDLLNENVIKIKENFKGVK